MLAILLSVHINDSQTQLNASIVIYKMVSNSQQLKIQQWNSIQQNKTISIPLDDYVFHMIVRRGKLVSKPHEAIYVQAIDFHAVYYHANG